MKRVVFCTLRDNKGATGGPGGVLYMLKEIIGENISNEIECKYLFNFFHRNFRGKSRLNKLIFHLFFFFNPKSYYITHDIETAYILSKYKRKYSLVYHNQGPIIQEQINFGLNLTNKSKYKLYKIERNAFINAISLHFPSSGAADMYFGNSFRSCEISEINLGQPLYNTIPIGKICKVPNLNFSPNILTFFSLGTLTKAKGQDQVLLFLDSFLKRYNNSVRYLIVGNGPLKEEILQKCENLKMKFSHFKYFYFSQLSHEEVLYIHSISDIYVMLHRLSIFDFATLEAMHMNTAILLSPVGGNLDFDKESNIIFMSNHSETIDRLLNTDINYMKKLNKKIFDSYFSIDAFKIRYINLCLNNI